MTIQSACFRQYLRVFHPIRILGAGEGGGSPNGEGHKLLMQFSAL